MGASDIIFTNPSASFGFLTEMRIKLSIARVFSTFFRNGQVIETFRGQGIYQPAVDAAIEKVDQGGWVRSTGVHALTLQT